MVLHCMLSDAVDFDLCHGCGIEQVAGVEQCVHLCSTSDFNSLTALSIQYTSEAWCLAQHVAGNWRMIMYVTAS